MGENPAPNPAGFASSAAEAYGAALRFAAGLQEAQAQQKQQQATAAAKVQEKADTKTAATDKASTDFGKWAYENGGTEYNPAGPREGADGRPTLQRNDDDEVNQKPGADQVVMPGPGGKQYLMPKPGGKDAKANATETASILEKGGRPVDKQGNVDQMTDVPRFLDTRRPGGDVPSPSQPGKTANAVWDANEPAKLQDTGMFGIHAAAPEGSTVTPAGGKQSYFMPTTGERNADSLHAALAKASGEADAKAQVLPEFMRPAVAKLFGIDPEALKTQKFPPSSVEKFMEDLRPRKDPEETHAHMIAVLSDKTKTPEEHARAKNYLDLENHYDILKKEKPEGTPGAPKPATPTQSNGIERRKTAALAKAEAAFKKARAAADTPEDRKSAEDDLNTAKQAAQDTYEQEIERFGGSTGGAAPSAKPAPATPPKPGDTAKKAPPAKAAPAAPRKVSLAEVRAQAKAHGDSEADAIKRAKKLGFIVGQ